MSASRTAASAALRRNVLVVDDNPADAALIVESLAEIDGPQIDLRCAADGIAAIAALAGPSPFPDGTHPHLVLVDLTMPRMDGRALIEAIRETPGWGDIPIFVLSSSARSDDIADCYALGADDYVAKPATWQGYLALAATIKAFLCGEGWRASPTSADALSSRLRRSARHTTSMVEASRLVIESSRDCLRYRPRVP